MAETRRDAKCKLPDTLLAISNQRIGPLESRMTRKCPVRFGGGGMEKDVAGYPSRLTHTGSRTPASYGTSPAAYPTRKRLELGNLSLKPCGYESAWQSRTSSQKRVLRGGGATHPAKCIQPGLRSCDSSPESGRRVEPLVLDMCAGRVRQSHPRPT